MAPRPDIRRAVGAEVAEHAGATVLAHQLVHHHIEIDVEAAGMGVGDESAERVDAAIAGRHAALLIFAA